MNIPLAIAIVVAAAVVAMLLMLLVRRRVDGPVLLEPARGTPMITLAGTAFAVLLAFITLAAFQTYHGAKDGAGTEAVAVLDMFRTASLFPARQRDELRGDLDCYGRAVIHREWPAMRRGASSPLVDHWVAAYRALFDRLDLGTARARLGFQELLTTASNRTDGRRQRLSEGTPSVPTPLWIVLVLGGCVAVLIQLVMADPRERPLIQCGMIAGVAVIVASGLLMIDFLDHPYRDRTGSIQPTEMRETLKMTAHMQPGLQVPCRTDGRSLAV